MTSDLPPGVSVNDIPGNRPDDLRAEARWDSYYKRWPWLEKLQDMTKSGAPSVDWDNIAEMLDTIHQESFDAGVEYAQSDLSFGEHVGEAILEGHRLGVEEAERKMGAVAQESAVEAYERGVRDGRAEFTMLDSRGIE